MNALLASVKKLVFQSGIGPYSVAMHKPSARWNPAFDQRHARIAVARFSSVMRVFGTGGTESGGGGGGKSNLSCIRTKQPDHHSRLDTKI